MTRIANVSIRPMSVHDLDAIVQIERAAAPEPWSRSLFAEEFDQTNRRWLVAVDDGPEIGESAEAILGFAGMMVIAGDAHIMNIAVSPRYQRQGLGHLLLTRLLLAAVGLGADAATLEERANNDSAIKLYRRLAFEPAGTRAAYYADQTDGLIMWLRDLSPYSPATTHADICRSH